MLAPTPPDKLCDAQGRPYFLWDCDVTLDAWRALTRDPDPDVRAYWIGAAMRQAKPDDVLTLLTWAEIEEAWPRLRGRLGWEQAFWDWRMAQRLVSACVIVEASPSEPLAPAAVVLPGVGAPHALLVETIVALLTQRDPHEGLDHLASLVREGGDLERALTDAPRKDGGFSPQSLAWVLDTLPRTNLTPELDAFRKQLIDRLLA